ncbi:MAG TPA: hypothetical protein VJ799_03670 [Nitrososphaeraceae archaeon]|nr:hypothetical protein [Nitrososphaeraceae archaeon]
MTNDNDRKNNRILTASELFYEKYRRIDAYPKLDKAYFIQKPFGRKELTRQLNEILLD